MPRGTIAQAVDRQAARVLERGQRFASFDQIRQRHFWSNYLLAYGAGNDITAQPYEVFKVIASGTGQGYPASVPLTLRETNWKNAGRVPDNQNFVITELGVTIQRPPAVEGGVAPVVPAGSIYAGLTPAIQALINPRRAIHPDDAANILYGLTLEMSYLTNNVPLGWCSDFSQSAGAYVQEEELGTDSVGGPDGPFIGDPTNGLAAAAFRRKLEVPILLQHGEAMGMVLRASRNIPTRTLAEGGAGWAEVRVDWWATESFVERS
jgi:hypothetical protein